MVKVSKADVAGLCLAIVGPETSLPAGVAEMVDDMVRDLGGDPDVPDTLGYTAWGKLLRLLKASGLKFGRTRAHNWLLAKLKAAARAVYTPRARRQVNPEGTFDNAGRWFPSRREDSLHLRGIRGPSRAWPYTYLKACRTLAHCRLLAMACLLGIDDVPPDVLAAARPAREALVAHLKAAAAK